jgi:Spy/CpxP family protein refolding chaperone
MRFLFVWIIIAAAALPALAQPAAAPPAQPDRREKIKQRVRALRAYTLTEQLDLDEATAAKLFPALAKYDDEFDKLLLARADLQRRLEAAGSLKDPNAVDKLVDEAIANQKALWTTEEQRLVQLRKILTPAQVARVLVVLPAMERKIQNQLKRAAQKPGARAPDAGGELGGNPFGKSPSGPVDPFADRPPAQKRAAPARPAQSEPCDPFSSKHGCAK